MSLEEENKKLKNELEKQKRKNLALEKFFQYSLDVFIVYSIDGLVMPNQSLSRILGYSQDEIMNWTNQYVLENIIHPNDRLKTLEAGKLLTSGSSFENLENRYLCKNGEYRWFSWTGTSDNTNQFRLTVGRDITEQKNITKELRSSEERFTKVFQYSPIMMAIRSQKDGRLLEVNKSWCNHVNVIREEAIGNSPIELGLVVDWETHDEIFGDSKKQLTSRSCTYKTKLGDIRQALVSTEEILFNNEPSILVSFIDVTEKIKMDREIARLDRLNLIGQMAGGIGHEIRNPMMTVRGFLQILQMKEKYSDEREYFDLMISELDRANEIIKEFLSLSKTKQLEMKASNLNNIIAELYPLMQASAFNENKQILFHPSHITIDIMCSEKDIKQLILNLVKNALEASPINSCVEIITEVDKGYFRLIVKDYGPGIPQEILSSIGLPFFTTKESGTGLGLAICNSIVQRHGAKMEIESSDKGTTFIVHFPQPNCTA
ncbi:PAS domain S-box protein [Heliobacillus mobilis]|uniref:histidine kinase n=1 Tax=Heliobacterium mobile TaxID=28064 RepID=A0A6I3SLI8_HELMO|nr:ATP-binding protein [Heliobacterium mobile]MTV49800.1 PAS domain S-box protein [Heliobacterium mobile]